MFAVFKTGGKQYRVAAEDVLKVARLKGELGEIVEFGEVLVVGGDSVTLGAPPSPAPRSRPRCWITRAGRRSSRSRNAGARTRGASVASARNSRLIRITEILTDGKKANKEVQPRPKRAPAPAAEAGAEADETAAAAEGATAKKARPRKRRRPKPRRRRPERRSPRASQRNDAGW